MLQLCTRVVQSLADSVEIERVLVLVLAFCLWTSEIEQTYIEIFHTWTFGRQRRFKHQGTAVWLVCTLVTALERNDSLPGVATVCECETVAKSCCIGCAFL